MRFLYGGCDGEENVWVSICRVWGRRASSLEFWSWRLMIVQKLERGLFGGKTMETLEVIWVVDSVVGGFFDALEGG